MELHSCAITGYRPTRFKWKYNENNNGCKRLKKRIRDQIALLYEKGVRRFYVGGTIGVDMWAGEIVLRLKEQPGYSDIELVVVMPFPGHDEQWDARSRERLAFMIRHSAEHIIVGKVACKEVFHQKNRYMIDHTDCLLAIYNNNDKIYSETGHAVRYAREKLHQLVLIDPHTAQVTFEVF